MLHVLRQPALVEERDFRTYAVQQEIPVGSRDIPAAVNREIPVGGGEIPVVGRDIPVAVGKGILAEGTVEGKLPVIRVEGVFQ